MGCAQQFQHHMSKSIINLNLVGNAPYQLPILKAMRAQDQVVLMLGESAEDHELWVVHGQQLELLGTLHDAAYTRIRQAKTKSPVTLAPEDFAWSNQKDTPPSQTFEAVTAPMLKLNLLEAFTVAA
jgi:hypothetical protein